MASLVVLAVAVAAGSVWLAYFWWKTRHLRRAMRTAANSANAGNAAYTAQATDYPPNDKRGGGAVIEGEAIVVETHEDAPHQSPADNTLR
jgi:hypothetical protein